MTQIDAPDLLAVAGLLLIGLAVYLAAGWIGVLGFAGTICIVAGVLLGRKRSTERYKQRI